mmetsp:Transcript_8728/g.14134  ORF Transcript_8728/g.14134 Transcript_8728/m.14134 type:complete len:263 (-) Transcript_8728:343-1131(-)
MEKIVLSCRPSSTLHVFHLSPSFSHIRTVQSWLHEATLAPFGSIASPQTVLECPCKTSTQPQSSICSCHTLIVSSYEPENNTSSFVLHFTHLTSCMCPVNTDTHSHSTSSSGNGSIGDAFGGASHIQILLSLLHVAINCPLWLQLMLLTSFSCPSSVLMHSQAYSPESLIPRDQTTVVLSKLVAAKYVPHGENSHDRIVRDCVSSNVATHSQEPIPALVPSTSLSDRFHSRTTLSAPHEANNDPHADQHTCQTRSSCPASET